jgi:hypothetical protein
LENPRESYSKTDLGIHGGIVLKKDRKTIWLEWLRLNSLGSGYEGVAGSCNSSHEPSGSMKYKEFDSSRWILLHGISHLLIYHCDFYKPSYISVHFLLIRSKFRISQLMYIASTTIILANHA